MLQYGVFFFLAPGNIDCIEKFHFFGYTGTVSVTNHGRTCQAWASQTPHQHNKNKDEYFPADAGVVGASNYCRSFKGLPLPFCYTTDPMVVYELCTLSICTGKFIFPRARFQLPIVLEICIPFSHMPLRVACDSYTNKSYVLY